jgi:hypothetical protein
MRAFTADDKDLSLSAFGRFGAVKVIYISIYP